MKVSKVLKSVVLSAGLVVVVAAGAFAGIADCLGKDATSAGKTPYPNLIYSDKNVAVDPYKVKCTTVKEDKTLYYIFGKTQSDCTQAGSIVSNQENCNSNDLNSIVRTIINTIIFVIGMISVVMIILGGISYATSQGDPGKVKKGKDTILYGIIGLVVSLLAFAIVSFVLTSLQ